MNIGCWKFIHTINNNHQFKILQICGLFETVQTFSHKSYSGKNIVKATSIVTAVSCFLTNVVIKWQSELWNIKSHVIQRSFWHMIFDNRVNIFKIKFSGCSFIFGSDTFHLGFISLGFVHDKTNAAKILNLIWLLSLFSLDKIKIWFVGSKNE